jgi:hypothetical protein
MQVVIDVATVFRLIGLLVHSKYKHIFWMPCVYALKDISKIQQGSTLVTVAKDVQMLICNHHTSLSMYMAHSRKEFVKLIKIRYASYYLLLERMLDV